MEVYKSLMQATFNHLKDNDRVLIIRGINEKKEGIFSFTKKHFSFVNEEYMKSNDYCIKLVGSTGIKDKGIKDKVEIIIAKCFQDDVVTEGLASIRDYYSKSKRDSPDEFLLEIFDGIESIGCCTFICSLKCLQVNFIFIMNQYRGKKLALWVWSILEDISFLYYEARKPIYLIFAEMDLYNSWQNLLKRYLVAKIVNDDIETIDDVLL
jgi:hypothetical protein